GRAGRGGGGRGPAHGGRRARAARRSRPARRHQRRLRGTPAGAGRAASAGGPFLRRRPGNGRGREGPGQPARPPVPGPLPLLPHRGHLKAWRTSVTQYVYFFGGGKADGNKDMKDLLGGKGSGLAEMTNAGLPVPPGFTVSTAACNLFVERKGNLPPEIDREIEQATGRLEKLMGKKLGAAEDPLLVSVRSGAKFSMPGMMDTILNLGLNDQSVEGLNRKTGNGRFAKDSYRRFIQMYGNVVLGIDKDAFEHELNAVKQKHKAKADLDLGEKALDEVIERYKAVVKKQTGHEF